MEVSNLQLKNIIFDSSLSFTKRYVYVNGRCLKT